MPKGVRLGGRAKGTPNKHTATVREAFATFVDKTFVDFEKWLHQTAAGGDTKGAADLYLRACEYHIPKLGRQEHTGKDGEPLTIGFSLDLGAK